MAQFTNFQISCLNAHNEYRFLHGVPELVLNKELCDYAQKYADQVAKLDPKAKYGKAKVVPSDPKTRGVGEIGENIFPRKIKSNYPGSDVADWWYGQMKHFDFGNNYVKAAECFTQMIWRESTELGVAIARSQKSKWTYVVARYKPCGNVRGQFTANVPRPKFTKFQISCLNAHNEYRSLHGVPELVLNEELCEYAQKYADEIAERDPKAINRKKDVGHSDPKTRGRDENDSIGENLSMMMTQSPYPGSNVADRWYKEEKYFDYGNSYIKAAGHFTAMMWKGSKEFGVAIAKGSRSDWTYVVGRYRPGGNVEGQFKANVPPPKNK